MKFLKKAINYFKESKEELTKVVWPTRNRVIEFTIAVIILVVVVGAFLGLFDFVFSKILTYLLSLKK
ncbi:MAG: preprotein translocase subunit SecE [Patescibacteria group bacterium]|jgi:preprotein translocase subunit SecE|nr:preprotein translocase subunit SecE [Patescibacteria group bacterium]